MKILAGIGILIAVYLILTVKNSSGQNGLQALFGTNGIGTDFNAIISKLQGH